MQLAGLLLATTTLALRWWLTDPSTPFPPATVVLVVASAALLARPRIGTVVLGLAAATLAIAGLVVTGGPSLAGSAGGLRGVLAWLQLAGLVVALVAGTLVLVHARRGRSHLVGADRPGGPGRYLQVGLLLVLAPVCAEYLAAYADTTGDPLRLLAGLLVFIPLYGCPALLIREVVRRTGRGWVSIILLAAAFGLVQAGLVDGSLFASEDSAIDSWRETFRATLVAPLGISGHHTANFLSGHVVYSICAPVAIAEAVRPSTATTPWLGRTGAVVAGLLWLAASALLLQDQRAGGEPTPSAAQLVVTVVLVAALVVLALRRRVVPPPAGRPAAPRPRRVLLLAVVLSVVYGIAPETWPGVALMLGALAVGGVGLALGSRRTGWGPRHAAAAAAGPLVVRALLAFTYEPLAGDVEPLAKLGHNLVLLVAVVTLVAVVLTRRTVLRSPGAG